MEAALAGRIGLLITFAAAAVALDTSIYTGMQVLDPSFVLYWKVDQPTSIIRFAVKANTTGFVGLGISEVGGMVGSDLMIGTVANGSALVGDYFAFGRTSTTVRPDSQQDVQTISGSQTTDANGTWTMLEFSRKLTTNDTNDRPIVEGINQVIWALGPSDNLGWHGVTRGGSQVVFFGGLPISPIPLTGLETVNLTAPAYKLPTNYTTYACNVYNLTSLGRKRHVIAFGPIIDTNAPETVHHTTVSSCTPDEMTSMRGKTPNEHCEDTTGCSRITFVWAVGGKIMYMPPNVGLPLGPGTGATILVMQVHYTNPKARSDVVDRSGMRFYLSPTLQPMDAGMFPLGPYQLNQIRIPPGIPSWSMTSTCRGVCTSRNIRGNITFFASMLHQHTAGSQVLTRVLRSGTEIASLGQAEYYDFNFQQTVTLPKPVTVLPSDDIQTTCIWDTTSRTNLIVGGESTQDEMCMNFAYYYPAQANLTGGCHDACFNNNTREGYAEFYPYIGFPGTNNQGVTWEVCSDMDNLIDEPAVLCEFGPLNGQNWTGQRKHGQQSRSLSTLSPDMITKLQVKADGDVTMPPAPPPPKKASAQKVSCKYMLSSLSILLLGTLVHFL